MLRKILFAAIAMATLGLLIFDGLLLHARYQAAKVQAIADQRVVEQVPDKASLEAQQALARGKELVAQFEYVKAAPYLKIAADHGLAEAWFLIGETCGEGTAKSVTAYQKAADLGYNDALPKLLEYAIGQGDFAKAKRLLEHIRTLNVRTMLAPKGLAPAIDACLAAGKTVVSDNERKAIASDGRNNSTFTPNDALAAAVAFANGWGVPPDRKRALSLVCQMPDLTWYEWENMSELLSKPAVKPEPFLFCDYTTSGRHGGQCEGFEQDKVQRTRDNKLAALTAPFTAEQKAAYEQLHQAAEAYFESHGSNEVDLSGSLRGAFYANEVGAMQGGFCDDMTTFEQGKLPPKDNYAEADKALNKAFSDLLKDTDWSSSGTVTPEGLRATQRLWLNYRDAWAAFGTLRYPATNADDWKAWVTRVRVSTLKAGFRSFE